MRDCFLLHRWRWRRLWLTTTHSCGRSGAGSWGVLSFRLRGSRSSKRRLRNYRLQRLEQASQTGACQGFSVLIRLRTLLSFANSMLDWRVPVPAEGLSSNRLRRRSLVPKGSSGCPESSPQSSRLISKFHCPVAASALQRLPTAGLHHPLRSVHRFTYQPGSSSGIMHGFVNVFLAAAFLRAGMETKLAVQLLDEQSADAFHFNADGFVW